MKYLNAITAPNDLKKLSKPELSILADEIRARIIEVISKNGGHLASSLGAVELAIAIHYVFDIPNDKVIWDVSHQAYAHKILTGRNSEFDCIRQHEGISGFTRSTESPYDAFSTGHSSTSISAGLGIACAKQIKGENAKVISVIGDGSMTAGMAYEALNHAGDIHKDLIVILNDNDMSISPNVGAISALMSRTFSIKYLQQLRSGFASFLKSLPKIGYDMYQFAKRSEISLKSFITPGILFEAFDFEYFGPINGHNIDHLIEILTNIKEFKHEPVLLHVTTKKGKGYIPAEDNPVCFHGVGCFEIETGKLTKKEAKAPSFTKVFGDTLVELAQKEEKIVAVTAAMPEGTGLFEFANIFPNRFFDVGIAEQHGVTFAAGLAIEGLKPVVAIYSTFLQRAYDQVLHDVCLDALPVVFALDRSGIVGEDGPTHHGLFDFSYLRNLPNMVIMAPKDENELRRMILTAIQHNGPVALRYPRGPGFNVKFDTQIEPIPIGKGELLSQGDDILILAVGSMVQEALKTLPHLLTLDVHPTIVNCRFVKPIDLDLIIPLAQKIPRIITIEENVCIGGFGSCVLEALASHQVNNFYLKQIGIADTFVEHGSQKVLRKKYGLSARGILNEVKLMLKHDLQKN